MATHQLTSNALETLKKEFENLINVQRPKVIKEIQEARALGDLSENSEYDAAKNQQSFLESRIAQLEDIFSNYLLICENGQAVDVISVGSKVKIYDMETEETVTYEILGTIDNDPANKKISNESPLAKAILGKKVNDVSEVLGIQDPYKVKIIEIL